MRTCPQCRRRYAAGEAFCPYDGARLRDAPRDPTRPPDDDDPLVGIELDGRYALQAVLGKGGMGTVYAARQLAISKPVAVKVLREVDDGGQAMGRFEREARSASKLGHPHIVDIFDFGRTPSPLGGPDALAFLVMELLDGEDLGALLAREGALPLERALPIILQCCSALGAAHAAGIVHRDLKPENLFLVTDPTTGQRDFVKIVDFGLAKISETEMDGEPGRKLTQTGMVFGTPHYMPPEQCTGRPTDARADIYALGIILHEALTGKPPFEGNTFMEVINQHLIDPPPPLRQQNPAVDVPPAVEAVIGRALGKLAEDRQPSMQAFARELLAALAGTRWAPLAESLRHLADEPEVRLSSDVPAAISPEAFAKTPIAHAAVDVEAMVAAQKARAEQPIALVNPKVGTAPTQPPSGSTPLATAPTQLPSGSTPLAPPSGSTPLAPSEGAKKVIPETRRAIDVAPPSPVPKAAPARPAFSSPPPAAPRFSPSSAPPPAAGGGVPRVLGWLLGAVLLLLLGGALGYGALLLAG